MQAQSQGVAPAKGMFSSFASIFREEGLSGLYRVNENFCDYNFVKPSRVPCRAGVLFRRAKALLLKKRHSFPNRISPFSPVESKVFSHPTRLMLQAFRFALMLSL